MKTAAGAFLGEITETLRRFRMSASCGGQTCTYSLNPPNWTFPAEGGSQTVNVNTQAGCAWNASTVNPWITLNPPTSGTGNGSVSLRRRGKHR